MIEKFKDAFREEAIELLNNLESTLLELENDPHNMDTVSAVFRTMHTIKGSSAMFGFETISRFTHEVESVMDLLREGAFTADRTLIDLTLQARDLISALLDGDKEELSATISQLVARFKAHAQERMERQKAANSDKTELPPKGTAPSAESGSAADAAGSGEAASAEGAALPDGASAAAFETYRIRFIPSKDVFKNGTKPLLLLDELRSLGTTSIQALRNKLPALSELDPERCYLGWELVLTTDRGEDALRDVFIFVESDCELSIQKLGSETEAADLPDAPPKRLGEILVERGIASEEAIKNAVSSQRRLGEVLVEEKIATPEEIQSALDEQEHLKKMRDRAQSDQNTSSIRVASEKLDALVDLVGELVTLQARLNQTAGKLSDGALSLISEQFERLVAQLRDNTMSIRMLPIGTSFSRFRRLVRDLSTELGKEIELETHGAETELDKTVIEKLGDPLVHIIRNSIDHGIEMPEERMAAGKHRSGVVTLAASHSGAHVLIEISDDGKGLDGDRIYAKAVERGLIQSGQTLTEDELFALIFAPGFSTAKVVTSVSGRGVGMDVVKRQIDSLGGTVLVQSERGKGTTVTLKIPLTLAIIDGLLVRVAAEYYVIPLSSVDSCIELKAQDRATDRNGRSILNYHEEILPYMSFRELFSIAGTPPAVEQIVVVNAHEAHIGLVVDEVIGDNQTVIKPLGRMFKNAEGLSGATILGDGTVALIVDVNRMALSAQKEEAQRLRNDRGRA